MSSPTSRIASTDSAGTTTTTRDSPRKKWNGRHIAISSSSPSPSAAISSGGGRRNPARLGSLIPPKESRNAEMRIHTFTRDLPHHDSFEPPLTSAGFKAHGVISDGSNAFRMAATLPINGWDKSPDFPALPNALLGMTTPLNSVFGVKNVYQTVKAGQKSFKIGDTTGVGLAVNDLGAALGQTTLGVGYIGLRANAIGSAFAPSAPPLSDLTPVFGKVGGIGGGVLYGLAATSEAIKVRTASNFVNKYREKAGLGAFRYLRKRMGLDEKALSAKALNGKTADDFQKEGLGYLRPLAKRNIELLKKHGKLGAQLDTAEKVDRYIRVVLGHGSEKRGNQLIEHVGKTVLIDRLREKKKAKMQRILGDTAFKEVAAIVKKGAPTEIDAMEAQKVTLDNIVLGKISAEQKKRWAKIALYTAGAITTLILTFVTGGGFAVAVALAAAIVYTGVAACEFYLSYQALEETRKNVETPPGRYDWLVASAPGLLISAATLIVLGVLSAGTIPLAIGIFGALLMLGKSAHHYFVSRERQQTYCDHLMNKRAITFDEFTYLVEHMSKERLITDSPLKKLSKKEEWAIKKLLKSTEHGLSYREKLLQVIELRKKEHEQDQVKALHSQLRPYLAVPGVSPLPRKRKRHLES